MSWYNGNDLFPHEVDEGLIDPFGEDNVRKQGDNKVERALLPWERPPFDGLNTEER